MGSAPNTKIILPSSVLIDPIAIQVPKEIFTFLTALWSIIENKHRINSHFIIHFPTSEGVSERTNETSTFPVLSSGFLVDLDHKKLSEKSFSPFQIFEQQLNFLAFAKKEKKLLSIYSVYTVAHTQNLTMLLLSLCYHTHCCSLFSLKRLSLSRLL